MMHLRNSRNERTVSGVEISEVIRNYALVAAAVGGVCIAFWRALAADRQSRSQAQQVEQSKREHVTAIFADTVGRLDDEKLHVRLGAILTLRELVEAYPDLSRSTVDLLTAYLADLDYGDSEPPPDVREIMSIVIPRLPEIKNERS